MGFFGPSKAELEERINDLEDRLADAEDEAESAKRRAGTANDKATEAQRKATEEAEKAAEIAHALNELHVGEVAPLKDKKDVVETLDSPRIAWKATENQIAKLLIPEGATVVHPDGAGDKKRGDEAIVLAFYDYNDKQVYNGLGGPITREQYAEGPVLETEDRSKRSSTFKYEIGEKVTPNEDLNANTEAECRSGVHFFPSKQSALDWY